MTNLSKSSLQDAIPPLQSALGGEAEWISLRQVRETTTIRSVRDEKPEANSRSSTRGVMIEVMHQGHVGYAASPGTDRASLESGARAALIQAKASAALGVHRFNKSHRPAAKGRFESPVVRPLGSRGAGELNELLVRITARLNVSPKIVQREATIRAVETLMEYASSTGSHWTQEFSLISTDFQATAEDGPIVQTRSDNGGLARSRQAGLEVLDSPDLWDRVEKIGHQAVELLSAPECPTETTSLVLMPDQMMLQIHESIGHPLELDRIIGDERNYAGWSFVKPSDFGTLQYGSELMNVTFDPTVEGEFASYAFDDSGHAARRELLIENGVLKRGLGGAESRLRSGLNGVANTRACSWNRPPIDRMANLNLEPGTSSFDSIISSIERGVLMESNRSWSIDDFRNKFQFGCEYGKLIENGRITRTVRNPNYRGVTVPFWRSLAQVGDRATWDIFGTPFCGKGEPNQVIRVGHASPVCHFKNIEVFGGAS